LRKILFRVDGTSSTGLGHLMRCKQLSRLFAASGVEAVFVGRIDSQLTSRLVSDNKNLLRLDASLSELEIADKLKTELSLSDYSALVIDLAPQLIDDEMNAYSSLGLPIAVLDDHGAGAEKADLSISAIAYPGEIAADYHGADYIVLSPEIIAQEPSVFSPTVDRILIAMGGSDPFNISVKVLQDLISLDKEFELIVGPANQNLESLQSVARESSSRINIHSQVSDSQLPQIYRQCQLAIISFGISAYAMAYLQIPSIVVAHHQPGAVAAAAFEQAYQTCHFLGRHDQVQKGDYLAIASELIRNDSYRERLSLAGLKAVDGKGLQRVADLILTNLFR
jgi:UDP-2,4-diacetamido-2,4,6-trideoxy-beta-L-altropyranose hydrolase